LRHAANNSAVEADHRRTPILVQILVLLCTGLLGSGALRPLFAQGTDEEYQVKAAFLFHFAQLVEWPAGVLSAEDPFINLCIFNDEPRRKELQNTLEGKPIGTRTLHVRMLGQPQEVQGCNILFLSGDEGRRQTAILRSLHGLPVLTVGETANFLSDGGMIRFHFEEDRIRFDINIGEADSSHLKISSRLLLLATSVTPIAGTGGGRANYAH
jgi:hypothetical protein